jgi:hypothetical protein
MADDETVPWLDSEMATFFKEQIVSALKASCFAHCTFEQIIGEDLALLRVRKKSGIADNDVQKGIAEARKIIKYLKENTLVEQNSAIHPQVGPHPASATFASPAASAPLASPASAPLASPAAGAESILTKARNHRIQAQKAEKSLKNLLSEIRTGVMEKIPYLFGYEKNHRYLHVSETSIATT